MRNLTTLRFVLLVSATLLVSACSRPTEESILVRGTFQAGRNSPFAGGKAACMRALDRVRYDSVRASSEGSFLLHVPGKGVYKFVFSAHGHPDLVAPLYIGKTVELVIDLPDDSITAPQIVFPKKDIHTAGLYDIYSEMSSYRPDHTGRPSGSQSSNAAENAAALTRYVQKLEQQVSVESDSILRQALLIARLATFSYGDTISPAAVRSILASISPVHPYWSFAPYHLANTALYADYPQYLDIAIENHPDTTTRAWLMLSFLPSRINTEDSTKARAYAARLVSEFPQTAFAALALRFLDMNAVEPTVGTSMPSFSFPALEPSAAHIRNADLKGKTYLISFWATWCPPCVNQIQFLSRAYAKYNNKGLEIVSVSLDEDPQKVRVFLKSKIAMPWLQAYAPAAFTNEFIKRLGIRSVPAEYLVDQEGRLLASSEQLIGSNLELTLSKVWTH